MEFVPSFNAESASLELVRELVERYSPHMSEWEELGSIPADYFRELGATGVLRERWEPGSIGGLPIAAAVTAAHAPVNAGVALAVSLHSEVFTHALILRKGYDNELVQASLDGSIIGCFAATEPSGGSDIRSIVSSSERVGDKWRLRGEKWFTTNFRSATHVALLVRESDKPGSFNLFVVPTDLDGITYNGAIPTLGVRSTNTAAWEFDILVEDSALVGPPGVGLSTVLRVLDHERLMAAVGLVASSSWALRFARSHMRSRKQFGGRLIDHQALRHRLADDWVLLRSAEALTSEALRAHHSGRVRADLVAAAKLHAARSAMRIMDDCLQSLGGRGYASAYPLERMLRDARLTRIGGGTDEVLREILAVSIDRFDPEFESEVRRCEARLMK